MSNAWSHLPNAHHIDWVLESVNKDSALWNAARVAAWTIAMAAARREARREAWSEARKADRTAAWNAAWNAARETASRENWPTARSTAWYAAWDAILIFVAWDDCEQFLNVSYEKLLVWATLSQDSRAVLLLPMIKIARKHLTHNIVSDILQT